VGAEDEIDASSWEPLPIMMPAVIRLPDDAMEAFQGRIVMQNSQAPVDAVDPESRDGEVLTDG
jgi:hypothetical protein